MKEKMKNGTLESASRNLHREISLLFFSMEKEQCTLTYVDMVGHGFKEDGGR